MRTEAGLLRDTRVCREWQWPYRGDRLVYLEERRGEGGRPMGIIMMGR